MGFQVLQKFRLEHDSEEVGMIHMPFTTPDRPLDIRLLPRNPAHQSQRTSAAHLHVQT